MRWALIVFVALLAAGCADDPDPVRAERVSIQPLVLEDAPPPDAVEEPAEGTKGCALLLELTDESTGKRVHATVVLYRLDVPADDQWTEGDLLEREIEHRRGPCRVQGLPAGRYRIRVARQRDGTDDPPSFEVSGPETRVRFALPMPRGFQGRLIVVDERGAPIRRGRSGFRSSNSSLVQAPTPWLRLRQPRNGDPEHEDLEHWLCHGDGDFSLVDVRAEFDGFKLYPWSELMRDESCRSGTSWEFEGATPVTLIERYRESRDVTYLAVSVNPQPIRDAIRLPDGSAAEAAGAEIEIDCVAVLLGEDPHPERWRTVELSVCVELAGYRPLKFLTTVGESTRTRTLTPN